MIDKEIDIQKLSGELVGAEVYANVGGMVEYILSKGWEDREAPFSWDDINTRPDPTDWDADRLNTYLVDEMDRTWEDVTGDPFEAIAPPQDEIEHVRRYIASQTESADHAAQMAEYAPMPLEEWDAYTLNGFLEDYLGEDWEANGFEPFKAETEEEREDRIDDQIDDVRDYIRDNADAAEVYEWWAVSDWLAGELGQQGEIILDACGLAVWGRQTTGQAIKMDWCIQRIAVDRHTRWAQYT